MPTVRAGARRGSVYPMVLATATVVATIGVAGILVQRRMFERSEDALEVQRAAALARSAVELGLQRIAENADWRDDLGSGLWYNRAPAASDRDAGTISLWAVDPTDNDMDDSSKDPVLFTGIGEFGGARRAFTALYAQAMEPNACLGVAACFKNDVTFGPFSTTVGTGTIHTEGSATAGSATVHTPVAARGSVGGTTYHGGKTSGAGARAVPKAEDVALLYRAMGATTINRASLPKRGPVHYLENTVLSRTNNPFGGGTNPLGIYFIDMNDAPLVIQNVRIEGTLVIREPKNNESKVMGSCHIGPAVEGYPSLIVYKKGMTFAMSASPLSEAGVGVNFNPPAAPYAGESDSSLDDAYPSVIHGIVLIDEDVTIAAGTSRFGGHLMGEKKLTLQAGAVMQLDGGTESYDSPPPAFGSLGDFEIARWDRATD